MGRAILVGQGGKKRTGLATARDVLNGITFSNAAAADLKGEMWAGEASVSPDSLKPWTIRTSAADNAWRSVCYGNGLFVAVADSGVGNRVMTADVVREITPASSKVVIPLGRITATFVSDTVVTFNIRLLVPDASALRIENFIVQLTNLNKTTTAGNLTLTWTYNSATGVITCTASATLFTTGSTAANIYVVL